MKRIWIGLCLLAAVLFLVACHAADSEEAMDTALQENGPDGRIETVQEQAGEYGVSPRTPAAEDKATPSPLPTPEPTPAVTNISLRFVGDLMCCEYQMEGARTADGGYDFNPPFDAVREELASADLSFGNFETSIYPDKPLCGNKIGFNAPMEYLEAVEGCGFDILFTANNHSIDYLAPGTMSTLQAIRSTSMEPVGTYATQEEAERICFREVNGIKLAILSYTGRSNKKLEKLAVDGEPAPWMLRFYSREQLISDAERARSQGAQVILMYLHEGYEKEIEPNRAQCKAANDAFEAGVDIVIMSHTHSLQTMEKRQVEYQGQVKTVFCAYGLGNFMSSAIHDEALNNIILNLDVTYDREKKCLTDIRASYLLTFTIHYPDENGTLQFRILPLERLIAEYDTTMEPGANVSLSRLNRFYAIMRQRMDKNSAAESVPTFLTDG